MKKPIQPGPGMTIECGGVGVEKLIPFHISLKILSLFFILSSNKFSGVKMKNRYVGNNFSIPTIFFICLFYNIYRYMILIN